MRILAAQGGREVFDGGQIFLGKNLVFLDKQCLYAFLLLLRRGVNYLGLGVISCRRLLIPFGGLKEIREDVWQ